ncbi:MAG: hypothetical protein OEV42_07915 [Deltaproteobacteria bacterium]|nr:hypothetical protein [Deltaproteobacteria bacterium]
MDKRRFILPGGYIDDSGLVHREIALCHLSGREEELLADNKEMISARLVSTIISRCVSRIGKISPVPPEVARDLLIADRQYIMLKLREATFGDRVQATIRCPWPDCGKKVDIDFSTADIPFRESRDKGPLYKMTLSRAADFAGDNEDGCREITFRLPNGGDQEEVSPYLYENEGKALTELLKRCISSIGAVEGPGDDLVEKLSPRERMEIEKRMEEVAPGVELKMEANCPECGRDFDAPFDLQEFFFGELRTSRDLLYREVHYLAYHYHWSEGEILEMPRAKRRGYIEILADEMERLNNAVG